MSATLGFKEYRAKSLTYNAASDVTLQDELGILRFEIDPTLGLYVYRQVKLHASSAAGANGTPVGFTDVYHTTVSTDFAGGGAVAERNLPAGVCVGTLTAGNIGYVQCGGYHSAVLNDGTDTSRGDNVILSGTDAVVTKETQGTVTYKRIGVCVTTITGTTTPTQLCCSWLA